MFVLEEGASAVAEIETRMLVLEGTSMPVDVALAMVSVVEGNAVPDAVAKTASRLAKRASCACKRSSIALRNSNTSCGRSDRPSCIDVTVSINSAASASGVELGTLCKETIVASRRMTSYL
jgi:hypothetical protein